MSLVVNKPNRVYISSGDSTGYSPNNSRFDISFENPIYFPKTVSLVSAEYSNSFYNILDTDKFIFYEVYQDGNGVIKGIIKQIRITKHIGTSNTLGQPLPVLNSSITSSPAPIKPKNKMIRILKNSILFFIF